MKTSLDFCYQAYPKISRNSWKTYLGWIDRLKRFAQQEKATEISFEDIRSFLASLHTHHRRTFWNCRQAIKAVYRQVLWAYMPPDFQQAFLLEFYQPAILRRKRYHLPRQLLSPGVPLPTPHTCDIWVALLPNGKPQRACRKVYVTGIKPQVAAQQYHTTISAMKRVLRIGKTRAAHIGIDIPVGAGLRTLRTVHILSRIQRGDDPAQIIRAVGLKHLASLTPYLRLAGLIK
jgi:hypothetical protein